jgi:2-hydroxy-6-oxonona-2,4-dienedioate hydrolase
MGQLPEARTPMTPVRREFRSRTIEVNGRSMFYRASAGAVPAGRPALVLVHGFVHAGGYMLPTAAELAGDFRTLAPDLPGFGDSVGPRRALDVAELGQALADWLAALGLESVALLGNSFGCQVAVECVLRAPGRVSHLILQGPTTDPAARTVFGQLREWLRNSRYEPPISHNMVRDYWKAGLPRAIATARYLLRDAIETKLPRVRVPTLVVRGELDPLVPQRWAEEVVRLLPDGRLVLILGAAHTVVFFAARQCAEAVRAFLVAGEPAGAAIGRVA